MFNQSLIEAKDDTIAMPESLNELKEIQMEDLADVSGGIGTVTIASPAP